MTRYGFDPVRRTINATWAAGGSGGDVSATVAELDAGVGDGDAAALVAKLTALSAAAWGVYTHPAESAEGGVDEPNTEAWRRGQERDRLEAVVAAIRNPNLPDEHGWITSEYSAIGEGAHRVGRVLHRIGSPALTDAIAADAAAEIAAVDAARTGDLSGRAAQAAALCTDDPIPTQVAAADRLLEADLFASSSLFDLDAGSAAVAAARWLYAAARAAAAVADSGPVDVLYTSNMIEPVPVRIPASVVAELGAAYDPREVVTRLIREAREVGTGQILDVGRLATLFADAATFAERHDVDLEALGTRLCLLDPARPAFDLLEDLLSGINGCFLVYQSYAVPDGEDPLGQAPLEDFDDEDGARFERDRARLRAMFVEAVRDQARELPAAT